MSGVDDILARRVSRRLTPRVLMMKILIFCVVSWDLRDFLYGKEEKHPLGESFQKRRPHPIELFTCKSGAGCLVPSRVVVNWEGQGACREFEAFHPPGFLAHSLETFAAEPWLTEGHRGWDLESNLL